MDDRDGKKPYVIPKTHTSSKDVLISEKPDSRNVTELFNDMKSYSLEVQFDFRAAECKSCDTIRNQNLQKLYSEKRIKMKKDHDPVERLAFHLIVYRDDAVEIAKNGLRCDQLGLPIKKYLGNPKDGVSLFKRPDVLLTASGAQGLYRFGLLVCKVLLGKGFATIPSASNEQLAAQLHYDHHFSKLQPNSKEQRHIEDLLGNSLIFFYEHEDFQTVSHPRQILPLAILWYDLTDKFAPELTLATPMTTLKVNSHQDTSYRNGLSPFKRKLAKLPPESIALPGKRGAIPPSISQSDTCEGRTHDSTANELSALKYPSQFLIPYQRLYSPPTPLTFSSNQQQLETKPLINLSRDPRLLRAQHQTVPLSSDTAPLSPQHLNHDRLISNAAMSASSLRTSSDEALLLTKPFATPLVIPTNSSLALLDPRLPTCKATRHLCFMEPSSVKRALMQQKRLDQHHDSKHGLPAKTSYAPVRLLLQEVSDEEYARLQHDEHSSHTWNTYVNGFDCSSVHVSVVDCFKFGFTSTSPDDPPFIDLEQSENQLAYEQIRVSDDLMQREKQLNSQEIRLRLREKRHHKLRQQHNERTNGESDLPSQSNGPATRIGPLHARRYTAAGRQWLKEHRPAIPSTKTHVPSELLEFFSREYRSESRAHVKHLLAELAGVLIEKYQLHADQTELNRQQNQGETPSSATITTADDRTVHSIVDMDLDSPSSQELGDHDERFRLPYLLPPPPPLSTLSEGGCTSSFLPLHTLPNGFSRTLNDSNAKDQYEGLAIPLNGRHPSIDASTPNGLLTKKLESTAPTPEPVSELSSGHMITTTRDQSPDIDNPPLLISDDPYEKLDHGLISVQRSSVDVLDPIVQSRDELVKLLAKEVYVSKSSSPVKMPTIEKDTCFYRPHRRRSHDGQEKDHRTPLVSHRHIDRTSNHKTRRERSPISIHRERPSTRTVKLITNRSIILNERHVGLPTDKHVTDSQTSLSKENADRPVAKRIKLDPMPSKRDATDWPTDTHENNLHLAPLMSLTVPNVNDHDCRQDSDERRRIVIPSSRLLKADKLPKRSSRSRSTSPDRRNGSDRHLKRSHTKDSNQRTKEPRESSSSSSINHRHERKPLLSPDRRDRRERTSDLNARHPALHTKTPVDRHRSFVESAYRTPPLSTYPTSDPPKATGLANASVRHKRFNYNHQSVADYPQFAKSSAPVSLTSHDRLELSGRHRSISPTTSKDRKPVRQSTRAPR